MKRTRDEKLAHGRFAIGPRSSYWVVLPFAEGWLAAQRLMVQENGAVTVAELRVYPAEDRRRKVGQWSESAASIPKGGLSASLLRSLSVGGAATSPVVTDWVQAMLSETLRWPARHRALAKRVARDLDLPRATDKSTVHRRGRKPSRDREFYQSVAAHYRRWISDNPAKKIAETHGVSGATARTWIHTARHKYGLLAATAAGRLPPS
ncbi:MAG: hypothetical protein ABIW19_13100 [Vicinamibacterales bacterium]